MKVTQLVLSDELSSKLSEVQSLGAQVRASILEVAATPVALPDPIRGRPKAKFKMTPYQLSEVNIMMGRDPRKAKACIAQLKEEFEAAKLAEDEARKTRRAMMTPAAKAQHRQAQLAELSKTNKELASLLALAETSEVSYRLICLAVEEGLRIIEAKLIAGTAKCKVTKKKS